MSSSAVTQTGPKEVAQQTPQQDMIEEKETSASASASGGLNLNLAGAVSGLFSSKSKKDTAADGSSIEQKEEQAQVKGAGAGNLQAGAAASAEEKGRQMRAAIQNGNS